jgi:diaminopimelate decarboxylase
MTVVAPPQVAAPASVVELGGCDPEALAAEFGTPLFVYDFAAIDRQVSMLRSVLPPAFELAFAVKANPSLGVVAHLAGLGLGADVASRGELATVLRAGIGAERVVMTSPGKRDDELATAVRAGVGIVTVESLVELVRLERLAAEAGRTAAILLRARASEATQGERVRIIGDAGAGKFGMGPDDMAEAARRAVRSAHLELLGVHAFGASNVLDADVLADHAQATVELGRRLASEAGFELRAVDIGGGLGIPYADGEAELDLDRLGHRLARLEGPSKVLIEPGRFLVGPAGTYLARAVDRKDGVVILDGGINHLLRPALTGQEHRVRRIGGGGEAVGTVTVAGPLCSGLDVLAAAVEMEPPNPGDLLAVLDAGAYGFTESMPYFLSHPIPAEVAVRDGQARLLRPRVEPEAFLAGQHVPAW